MGISLALNLIPGMMGGSVIETMLSRLESLSPANLWAMSDASGQPTVDSKGGKNGVYAASGVSYQQTGIWYTDATKAAVLDGSAGYIDLYNGGSGLASLPSVGTLVLLFQAADAGFWADSANHMLFTFYNGSKYFWVYKQNSNNLQFYFDDSAVQVPCSTWTDTGPIGVVLKWSAGVSFDCYLYRAGALTNVLHDTTVVLWSGAITRFLVGALTTTTSRTAGTFGPLAIYTSLLTDAQIASVFENTTRYVSSTGDNANTGRTAAVPWATLQYVDDNMLVGGTAHVVAPAAAPFTGKLAKARATALTLTGDSVTWYVDTSTKITSGWSDAGGGIYSRVYAAAPRVIYVDTIANAYGNASRLLSQGATNTPAENKFGYTGGSLYVHLPGAADANANTIICTATDTGLTLAASAGSLVVEDAYVKYPNDKAGFRATTGVTVTARRCAVYNAANGGFSSSGAGAVMTVESCNGYGSFQDLFSADLNCTLNATDCYAEDAGDDGFTSHTGCHLNLSGCHTDGTVNKQANDSVVSIDDCLFENSPADGLELNDTVSGTVSNSTMRNNTARGIDNTSSGAVTFTNNTSGVAQGNGLADLGV